MAILGYVKSFGRMAVCVAASMLFAVAVIAPQIAAAHIGKCRSPALLPGDDEQVIVAARRILPPDLEPIISNRCLVPDRAYAEIATHKVQDKPGVTHWWVASCHRQSRDWMCDPAEFEQEVEKRLIIRGTPLQVAITFDEGTVPEAVESVATRALSIYADPGARLPFCGGIQDPGNRWTTLRTEHPLEEGKVRVHVTAQPYVDLGSVLLDKVIQPDDIKIEIQLPIVGPDHQDPRPHDEAKSGHKCAMSGTSTVAVDCQAIASAKPIAVESPCWMAMAP
jgi:hypothetical protein